MSINSLSSLSPLVRVVLTLAAVFVRDGNGLLVIEVSDEFKVVVFMIYGFAFFKQGSVTIEALVV